MPRKSKVENEKRSVYKGLRLRPSILKEINEYGSVRNLKSLGDIIEDLITQVNNENA